MIKTKKLIILPLVLGFLIAISLSFLSSTQFNAEAWDNWQDSTEDQTLRGNMVDDLTQRYDLIGMNYEEVIQLLGTNYVSRYGNLLAYQLGLGYCFGIDYAILSLTFDQNILVNWKISCT